MTTWKISWKSKFHPNPWSFIFHQIHFSKLHYKTPTYSKDLHSFITTSQNTLTNSHSHHHITTLIISKKLNFLPTLLSFIFPKTPTTFIASPPRSQTLSQTHIPTTLRQLSKYSKNWNFSSPRIHSFLTKPLSKLLSKHQSRNFFNQDVSPGMPLASSVDKDKRTETMPFI